MKVSIVIPTLKEEGYIEKTVRQFTQLTVPHEVIVADGGSKDKTVEIARTCADHVTQSTGAPSPARQRNTGAKLATGEILVFVDSSVQIPDLNAFFTRVLSQFDADPALVAVTCSQRVFPEIETSADRFFLGMQDTFVRIQNNFLRRGSGTGKCMMMRRAAFEQVHGFRDDIIAGEDHNLMLRLSTVGRTYFDPTLRIFYPGRREHGLGWSRLMFLWTMDLLSLALFNRSHSKEWKPVR